MRGSLRERESREKSRDKNGKVACSCPAELGVHGGIIAVVICMVEILFMRILLSCFRSIWESTDMVFRLMA
jgi:hypothetical protein